ncbi:Smr/MutS family protein [Oceaniradius stylonematis]|uniref:Smr/MutS family protein n=1 Tax=Oceaniradius stylonematis TaxID=2184161 RepID=UPI0035D02D7E
MTEHRKSRKPTHPLSLEDRILWNKVARTVNPLDRVRHRQAQQDVWDDWVAGAFGEDAPTQSTPARRGAAGEPNRSAAPPAPFRQAQRAARAPGPVPIEQPVYRKLSRGRTPIDASIDLHNMNQNEAMSQLHRFLTQARARDCRHVLVITGKGRSPHSDGVLRRMVPFWLSREPFAGLVSGIRSAARGHGGDGAFYVRLRKTAEPHGHRHR